MKHVLVSIELSIPGTRDQTAKHLAEALSLAYHEGSISAQDLIGMASSVTPSEFEGVEG